MLPRLLFSRIAITLAVCLSATLAQALAPSQITVKEANKIVIKTKAELKIQFSNLIKGMSQSEIDKIAGSLANRRTKKILYDHLDDPDVKQQFSAEILRLLKGLFVLESNKAALKPSKVTKEATGLAGNKFLVALAKFTEYELPSFSSESAPPPRPTLRSTNDRIAPTYGDKWDGEIQQEVVKHRETFLRELGALGGPIIDAGTGSGHDAAWFEAQGRKTIGIDLSNEMLSHASKRHPEVVLVGMDFSQVEFGPETVAGWWCNASFHHLQPQVAVRALVEIFRVLRPGGLLFLRVKRGDGEETQRDPAYPEEERYFKLYQQEELEQLVGFYGFKIIDSGIQPESTTENQPAREGLEWVYILARRKPLIPTFEDSTPLSSIENSL